MACLDITKFTITEIDGSGGVVRDSVNFHLVPPVE